VACAAGESIVGAIGEPIDYAIGEAITVAGAVAARDPIAGVRKGTRSDAESETECRDGERPDLYSLPGQETQSHWILVCPFRFRPVRLQGGKRTRCRNRGK